MRQPSALWYPIMAVQGNPRKPQVWHCFICLHEFPELASKAGKRTSNQCSFYHLRKEERHVTT